MNNCLLTGLWHQGEGARYVWYEADWSSFQSKFRELAANGFVLQSLDVTEINGDASWAGAWESGNLGQEIAFNLSWDQLLRHNSNLNDQGFSLVRLRSHRGTKPKAWAGLWHKNSESTVIVDPVRWEEFWSAWLAQHAAGNHMIDFETIEVDGRRLWVGLWHPGSGDQFLWAGANWTAFSSKNQDLLSKGYQLLTVISYPEGSARLWAGIWRTGLGATSFVADMTEQQFWFEWERQTNQGFRLSRLHIWAGTGYAPAAVVRRRLRLHLKILIEPTIPIAIMLDRMREVYEPAGLQVEVGSIDNLNQSELVDIEAGGCSMSELTQEQKQLYKLRTFAGDRDIVVYFVRTTIPPYNGCAAHPQGRPGAIISSYATEWTLAHEIGHVLGLFHIADSRRLMTGLGTANIINPPPDLMPNEITTMLSSELVTTLYK